MSNPRPLGERERTLIELYANRPASRLPATDNCTSILVRRPRPVDSPT